MKFITYTVLTLCCFTNVYSYNIFKGDDIVKLIRVAEGYKLFMPENNHDANPKRALFTVSVQDSFYNPELRKEPGFKYSWKRNDDDWTLYSESSFDFETQRRSYNIEVKVGPQHTSFTLYIENIDDEPPSMDCSADMVMYEKITYTFQNSTCSCVVSDPDGFLSRMTFNITGFNAKYFEMGFSEDLPDRVQVAHVQIINKLSLKGCGFDTGYFSVEAQDGAGHSTVPIKKKGIQVRILHYG